MKYTDLYSIISKYYPIGINRRDLNYHLFDESKLLVEKIESMLNSKDSIVKWEILVKAMQVEFPELLSVSPEYHSFDACFSAIFLIDKHGFDKIRHTQSLHCHLSFLGPYFFLYGSDTIDIAGEKNIMRFDPVITVSPVSKYEIYFDFLKKKIEEVYPSFKFIPFYLLKKRVEKLTIITSQLKENQCSSVFQALFIRENLTDYRTQGDIFYE